MKSFESDGVITFSVQHIPQERYPDKERIAIRING